MVTAQGTAARRLVHLPLLICLLSWHSTDAQRISAIYPRIGSINGATRLTIKGEGFAQENQFSLDGNADFGNEVTLVSSTRSVPCDVERDSTRNDRIMCYTRPMPTGTYKVRVSVDGVPIEEKNICGHCKFYTRWYRTPTIHRFSPPTGPPGTVVQLRGRIFSDVFGSTTAKSSNGLDVRFLRAYMGGMPCELLKPDSDELYGLTLDSESSHWGYMSCKVTGTYVGHHNLSYILDSQYGRSLPHISTYYVSSLNKLSMFQSYAVVTGITPSVGGVLGGMLMTVHGHYFDETNRPARVLVGGRDCKVLNVSDEKIVCKTPEYERTNMTVFPGSRGVKLEMWKHSRPKHLEDVLTYDAYRTGYSVQWTDTLSQQWPWKANVFVARLSGFFVPAETDNYTFYVKADDKIQLYFSHTGNPSDKVKIAQTTGYITSFFSYNSQKSETMRLEQGKPYYMEILMQDYGGVASLDVAFFREKSAFTPQQSQDARNEKQKIWARYDVSGEKQVVRFEGWNSTSPVQEVQTLTVSSGCFSQGTCDHTFYSLTYGAQTTGRIAVGASAEALRDALRSLWSIGPDTVEVTKQVLGTEAKYVVTFISQRGDFAALHYHSMGADLNVTVTEEVRGRGSLQTFTLLWGGIPSSPLPFNASGSEVLSALEAMVSAECPEELLSVENRDVKYFRDYERENTGFSGDLQKRGERVIHSEAFCGRWSLMNPEILFLSSDRVTSGRTYGPIPLQTYGTLCFAYRGHLSNKLGIRFSYRNSKGRSSVMTSEIPVLFNTGPQWSYICVDLLTELQTKTPGNLYQLLDLYLYRLTDATDFYVDMVYVGRRATVISFNEALQRRRPAALVSSAHFLEEISVQKVLNGSAVSYEISITPYHCAYNFPLLEVGFLERLPNDTDDMVTYAQDSATVSVTRVQTASPPLNGTFAVEIFGQRVEGLDVDISAEDLQYALQGIPEMGFLEVKKYGDCRDHGWTITWLTMPGSKPLIQIDSSSVVGVNPRMGSAVRQRGGQFNERILGDFLRVAIPRPQVEVIINGIPSNCTGDCSFAWSEAKTPNMTGLSPAQGSHALGTVLFITGSGFAGQNATVRVGHVECTVLEVTDANVTCTVGPASAGVYPVTLGFPSLGHAHYPHGRFNFTYLMGVTSIAPTNGSVTGGTVLEVSGYGFSNATEVTVGTDPCDLVSVTRERITCIVPAGPEGQQAVSLRTGDMNVTADELFTYDTSLTAVITGVDPQSTPVFGHRLLTITGMSFEEDTNGSLVMIGDHECQLLEWSNENITCVLPTLPPALYEVRVLVGNRGYPMVSEGVNSSIEYVLEVGGLSPDWGSLYGGTLVTITGSGFSPNITDNRVTMGETHCEVTSVSDHQLECVTQPSEQVVTVTNQGSHTGSSQGYAWHPSSVSLLVGDSVVWRWAAPAFIPGLGYRVFSVASPASTDYDGVAFSSGEHKTRTDSLPWSSCSAGTHGINTCQNESVTPCAADIITANTDNYTAPDIHKGSFHYRFTAPGVYYYSSGFIDKDKKRIMQGVVKVHPQPERTSRLHVSVLGIEAVHMPAMQQSSQNVSTCVLPTPDCPLLPETNQTSDSFSFSVSECASPEVHSISPGHGTVYDVFQILGSRFSNQSCAIEVTVGEYPCYVINSTASEINCSLHADSRAPVGVAFPVTVTVNNLGTAIIAAPHEYDRRIAILPVIDSIYPVEGATTGFTRLVIAGSGFSDDSQVTVAGLPCDVVSANYTHVACDTSPSPARIGDVMVWASGIGSSCRHRCSFEFSDALAPAISRVDPAVVTGPSTPVNVTGTGFGGRREDVRVDAGGIELEVTEVTETSVALMVGTLPAGEHPLRVIVMQKGLASGDATLTSQPVATLSPANGSLAGGTSLLITGNGFAPGNTTVLVGGAPCQIMEVTSDTVRCHTPAKPEGQVDVTILVFHVEYPALEFTYALSKTPSIDTVSPGTGLGGTLITVSGSGFGTDLQLVSVAVGDAPCNVSAINDTVLQCTLGDQPGGPYPVTLHHGVKGHAISHAIFNYELHITGIMPTEGGVGGGAVLTVEGSGFDPLFSQVLICGSMCEVLRDVATSTHLYCHIRPYNGSDAEKQCKVVVLNANESANVTNGYMYKLALTPVITDVSPRRGGTAGGTTLTITGSNFGTDISEVNVTLAGSVCDVLSANDTHIVCVTNAQRQSQQTKVRLQLGDRGIALMDHADFFYIDVWSSPYTWGGLPPPEEGTFVVITKNQTILLDTSTPILKMLLIQGGKLIFDKTDIELQSENILITDGGALEIGTEEEPFQHKAIITLHGHVRSPEIPVYGTKTLGVREGVLDLHGIPVPMPWTRLAQTAMTGSSTLSLVDAVTWRPGDEIVIASTGHRHSQRENEVMRIASVSADGRTLQLSQPLNHTHLGVSVTLPDGTVFEGRAEVGLLTRNIVIRGSINREWNDHVQACPEGFDTGEFATQTCFQGRFGEETGGDQFGGCIMFHAPRPSENLAIGRIEYVELFNAGQAFRLGRYPIHWHMMGDIQYKSYIRGCAIHQTYNRAVTIHNTHNLLVERNVIYNIMGGAFFIEDGIETGNILQYNLAVFVKQSTSLLNDDVTPAAYWVTNPNNIIRHNAAAGGTHFGFWYRMNEHPDGPSYDPNICQQKVPLGEFFNNTVHSQGWFGLWIFQNYFPTLEGTCKSKKPLPAVFHRLTTWNCEKGAEWVNVGAVQFNGFVMVNNKKAGVEAKRIIKSSVSGWGLEGGAAVVNSTIVGHLDELGLGSDHCSQHGVILPLDDGMSVIGTKFINFDRPSCSAIGVASIDGTCNDLCGGWSARFSGIQYFESPNKAGFRWEHEVALIDTDGSLTGNVDHKVVPQSSLLDPAHCSGSAAWSVGFPGAVCDHTVGFHRLAFNNPSPSSLKSHNVILTNAHGSSVVPYLKKRMTHRFGWMAQLPSANTYNWYFHKAPQITNISYSATFYGFREEDYVIVNHNLTQSPDWFRIADIRNGSTQPLNSDVNSNGDWYMDRSTKNLYYLVSGRDQQSMPRSSVDRSLVDRQVHFKVYRCFFRGCVPPPPVTVAPTPSRRPAHHIVWSNATFWKSSPENNFTVPQEGADVVIPSGAWIVLDSNSPPQMNKLTVIGVLEIPDTMNKTSTRLARSTAQYRTITLNATYISIQGGRLIAGWSDEPFRGELRIVLRGDHHTPDWPLPLGPNQGSKVLGVFGTLDLYGMPHNVYHTKLAQTAASGSDTLSLERAVDWQEGDEIVLSTTSYDPWETETRRIVSVSEDGHTLTLDRMLTYDHIAESASVEGTSQSYRLAGDVGLLTRNIKIIGQHYPDLTRESFGARLLVGTFTNRGVTYRGKAQIQDVEFYHTGQEGWTDYTDPRYSVAFLNLGQVEKNESYIRGCGFHHGFSPAIGVFGTNGLSVDNNVIFFTVGEGIRVWGNGNVVRRNLVTMSLWTGSYQGRAEEFNFDWNAAIEVNEGRNVVLQGNIVSGYERVGFRIDGEQCSDMAGKVARWHDNEAHGGLYGVYMNRDGLADCTHIQGFTSWRNFDFGIYFQVSMTVHVSNVTLVENGMGIMSLIYAPPSLTHEFSDKVVHVQGALIVGSSPSFNCSSGLSTARTYLALSQSHRAPRPPQGGRSGICWPTFESNSNNAPAKPHPGIMSYNAISGLMTVTDTTFVGFKEVCSGQTNYMFMTNPGNEDLQHPVHVERITIANSTEEAKAYIHRADVTKANPTDCVDMDCDAKKKSLLNDLDGSFLGAVGSVVPQSEYEWNGDPRRGVGDYRIPTVMLTRPDGSRIPVDEIAPNKGVIRDSNCTYMSEWQSYRCSGMTYRMLVIESLDADTETRRLSPVAVVGDGYVDLINGPQDHGWCGGYTCQERVSLFHSIVATNKSFDIFFTSTSPQMLRLMLLNAKPSEAVRVAVFYSNPQRLDVYVNDQLVVPTNAIWSADGTDYTLGQPSFSGEFVPSLETDPHGANYFDHNYKMLNVLLRGSEPLQIRTSPLLVVAFNLPAITEEEFFGETLIRNLAFVLSIPIQMIRITNIVREDSGLSRRRRATGITVEVEIRKPPVQQINSTSDVEEFTVLQNAADELGQAAISGNLSQAIGFNVSSIGVTPALPPTNDPTWKEVATEEVTRQVPAVQVVASVAGLRVVLEPVAGQYPGRLHQQPHIMAMDQTGNCVSVGVTTLTLTASLRSTNGNPAEGLEGNTTIPFSSCWANYTDLAISSAGQNITVVFTLKDWSAQSRSFTIEPIPPTDAPTDPDDEFPSIFDSVPSLSSGPLLLLALIYSLNLLYLAL